MSNTNTNDWLESWWIAANGTGTAACPKCKPPIICSWHQARLEEVYDYIAANYVAKGEHETAIDDELAAQKVMYTEAELQERLAAERAEAIKDAHMRFVNVIGKPEHFQDKTVGLITGYRIEDIQLGIASLTTNSREEGKS